MLGLLLILLALCAPAYADDAEPWIEVTRSGLADLLAKSAELDATKAQLAALQAVVVAQQRQLDAQAALIKTQDDMLERQRRLTALADEERGIFEGRAARVESERRALNAQAKAGVFALACVPAAVAAPPISLAAPALCYGIGWLYGYFGP